jgi:peptidyl-prolyl cis-trans isomerase C
MHLSKRTASIFGAVSVLASTALWAQGTASSSLDPNVVNLYLESRLQQQANQATPEQIQAIRSELADIYLLSDTPKAQELRDGPRLKAQIELQTRSMLAQAVAIDFITENAATEAEMRALYDEQVGLSSGTEFKARHILLETQSEAQEIIAQLEDGADFAELAKEKSTGPSGPSGGDLGWFPPDRMVSEFSEAVQQLENAQFTKEPVQTQFGWHVILREESRDAAPPPYDSVRDVLKQQVEGQKLQVFINGLRS